MAISLVRLTLYALISSMEEDMRTTLVLYAPEQLNPAVPLGEDLFNRARERASKAIEYLERQLTFEDLLFYCDFGDLIQLINQHKSHIPADLILLIKSLNAGLTGLIQVRNRVMHTRPLDYDDLAKTIAICDSLSTLSSHWPSLIETKERIEHSPHSLLQIEIPESDDQSRINHNLPLPDFDETGFIGRKKTVDQLKKACLGVYPVITVVGEGGLGKTALVLRVAYELLDSPTSPFDAIIFVSAKTTQLTTNEIKRIKGAITSSMGLFEMAADALGSVTESPIEDLLRLLSDTRVLLIIDNLETIVDDHLRSFLEDLPTGSKVLITSRIGLGAFEYPIVLQPLDETESVQLLRTAAAARGCSRLVSMSNAKVNLFCGRMKQNPLYIKWFVSAVQAGKRPEDIFANDKIFLQFCLSNVYDKLSEDAKNIVRALLSVGGAFTIAELAFLTEASDLELLKAVQELMRTNMLAMTSASLGHAFESKYELTPLARSYVGKFFPVSREEQRRILDIKHKLIAAGENIAATFNKNLISAFHLKLRGRSDWVIATYLNKALQHLKRQEIGEADLMIERARNLSPDYFEVYKVAAYVCASTGNYTDAVDNYERAIELAPESVASRVLYGGLLLREIDDVQAAESQFREAARLAPDNPDVHTELARCLLYQRKFDETLELLRSDSVCSATHERSVKKIDDLMLQCFIRAAEHFCSQQEPTKSLENIEKAINFFAEKKSNDGKLKDRIRKLSGILSVLTYQFRDDRDKSSRVSLLSQQVSSILGKELPATESTSQSLELGLELVGIIKRIATKGTFGFIELSDGQEVFLHAKSFKSQPNVLIIDRQVRFRVGRDKVLRTIALEASYI